MKWSYNVKDKNDGGVVSQGFDGRRTLIGFLLFQCREKKQKILDIRKNVKDAIVVRIYIFMLVINCD